ncbi:hypothetical protein F4806DRAFT_407850 [Annulohypoxylon nitens]|nr:hypothetical protein F4806DRAFT_407850 [Annulohypoxylon nitens]
MKGASRLGKIGIASRLIFGDFLRRWCFPFRSSNTLFTKLATYLLFYFQRASEQAYITLSCLSLLYYFLHFVTERYLTSLSFMFILFFCVIKEAPLIVGHLSNWNSMTSKTLGAEADSYVSRMICPAS